MKGETKEERFRRVGEKRVGMVLDSIRKLSQCANPRMYAWNDAQLKTIWDAIDTELSRCREQFETGERSVFKL